MPRRAHRVGSAAVLPALICVLAQHATGQNPGDPLFCQPQEGVAYLIVNGGGGIFTVDPDCYGNNINNDVTTSIATGQGGSLALTRTPGGGNYTYTPPTSSFAGVDTFSIPVTTVWNSAGGTGSAGGASRPGGAATLNITLNVIPATTTLSVSFNVPVVVPVPAGSISGCSPVGNAGAGPVSGAVYGCITGIVRGTANPAHGVLATSGNTLRYTPNTGYSGPDTFSYQAVGVNNDGLNALDSGDVTVQVTVAALPGTPAPPAWTLLLLGMACLGAWEINRRMRLQN